MGLDFLNANLLGGLTVLRHIVSLRPGAAWRYLADDAVFPYGELGGRALVERVGEVIAPLFVVFGLWTRLGALIIAGNMIVAVLLVHTAQFFALNATGGWELPPLPPNCARVAKPTVG